jgi:hypothetical protein
LNISSLNTPAQVEHEDARNTNPSQKDCLKCINPGKKEEEEEEEEDSINHDTFHVFINCKVLD